MPNLCKNVLQSKIMDNCRKKDTHSYLTERVKHLKTFPYARYATNSRFWQANELSGLNSVEANEYLSKNLKRMGVTSEISAFSNGLCVCSSLPTPAETAGIHCFEKMKAFFAMRLQKLRTNLPCKMMESWVKTIEIFGLFWCTKGIRIFLTKN